MDIQKCSHCSKKGFKEFILKHELKCLFNPNNQENRYKKEVINPTPYNEFLSDLNDSFPNYLNQCERTLKTLQDEEFDTIKIIEDCDLIVKHSYSHAQHFYKTLEPFVNYNKGMQQEHIIEVRKQITFYNERVEKQKSILEQEGKLF